MAVRASDVIAPMLSTPEVIVLFFAGMTGQTRFRSFLRGLVLKGNYLGDVTAALNVRFARAMTGFAARDLFLPAAYLFQFGVRCMRERFELIFVAVFARISSYIVGGVIAGRLLTWFDGLRNCAGPEPNNGGHQ